MGLSGHDYVPVRRSPHETLHRLMPTAFWNSIEQTPSVRIWYRLSREILLIVPSSAPVERVFSILTQGITGTGSSTQQTALHDYQLLSTMLKYNKDWPEPSM